MRTPGPRPSVHPGSKISPAHRRYPDPVHRPNTPSATPPRLHPGAPDSVTTRRSCIVPGHDPVTAGLRLPASWPLRSGACLQPAIIPASSKARPHPVHSRLHPATGVRHHGYDPSGYRDWPGSHVQEQTRVPYRRPFYSLPRQWPYRPTPHAGRPGSSGPPGYPPWPAAPPGTHPAHVAAQPVVVGQDARAVPAPVPERPPCVRRVPDHQAGSVSLSDRQPRAFLPACR